MGNPRFGPRRAVALTLATVVALVLAAPAVAASGDVLADLAPPGAAGGTSVAFDGQHLYYTDRAGVVLHRVGTDGSEAAQTPIVGAPGIGALAYDATRDAFWGVDVTGLNVYLVQKNGIALPHFTIVPALDLPGACNSLLGCSARVSIAYDGIDDTLWYVPQGSSRVYHFDTVGHPLGFFDPSLAPQCPLGTVSGVAAGRTGLYLSAGTCVTLFRYDKNGARLTAFDAAGSRVADVECDSDTFAGHAAWARADDGHLRAVALPPNTCVTGGGVSLNPNEHWFTGGGTSPGTETVNGETGGFEAVAVHHGFVLHCDVTNDPNRLQMTWTSDVNRAHHRFHMTTAVASACSPENEEIPLPHTIAGEGTGRFDGNPPCPVAPDGTIQLPPPGRVCADVEWRLTDNGEPNVDDLVHYVVTVRDSNDNVLLVLAIECQIQGNIQEHPTS
jgi:hypothetical protein